MSNIGELIDTQLDLVSGGQPVSGGYYGCPEGTKPDNIPCGNGENSGPYPTVNQWIQQTVAMVQGIVNGAGK